ncbi:hypothetical protein [Adlercreutzia caecimuris]|uniref:hypothetical protein n=1 Tax=Adlercreutzia caecimuris TaxID=671266 RepID=UPI00258C9C28|nr:hypothetical protein [Adlercreutzia caecimuris]
MIDGIECTQRSMECSPDCAWLMERDGDYQYCAVAVLAASGTETMGFCPMNSMERRES